MSKYILSLFVLFLVLIKTNAQVITTKNGWTQCSRFVPNSRLDSSCFFENKDSSFQNTVLKFSRGEKDGNIHNPAWSFTFQVADSSLKHRKCFIKVEKAFLLAQSATDWREAEILEPFWDIQIKLLKATKRKIKCLLIIKSIHHKVSFKRDYELEKIHSDK